MQIIFDGREAFGRAKTGKGQWTLGVLQEAIALHHSCIILTTHRSSPPSNIAAKVHFLPGGLLFHVWALFFALYYKNAIYCSSLSYITPCLFWIIPFKTVYIVVHDLIAFQPGKHSRKARVIERLTLRLALRRANRIATVSTSTLNDLHIAFPFCTKKNTVVCFAGSEITSFTRQIEPKNIVNIATLCPRKNQLRLIQAYSQLPEDIKMHHPLVLAGGKGWDYDEILEAIHSTKYVTYYGYVSASEYKQLLESAYIFAFPSLYEGFGLPVLDALTMGVPVLSSNNGSLQEIAHDVATLINPLSVDEITAGLLTLCTDSVQYSSYSNAGQNRAKQFTWSRTCSILFSE
jgi:glycosyltransferase involved in cell wall biosynthesis